MEFKRGDREKILETIRKGKQDARVISRAHALNLRYKNYTLIEIADILEVTSRTVFNIEKNYETAGLEKALYDDPRPGAPVDFDDRTKSQIVALVCSDPPEGFDRWTLRLVQEKCLEKGIVSEISHETVRMILEEHDLKPWQQESWCVPKLDGEFIARMEDVLSIYEKPLDSKRPVVCVDEKSIQLMEDVRSTRGLAPGKPKRRDNEYKRNGIANIFCAVEPLKGRYINQVTKNRKRPEFAKFGQYRTEVP